MKTVTHGLLCVLLLFFAAGLCAAQSAENTLVDTLHEIDEAARSAVKALGEAHDEFVRGSRTEYGDNEVKFKMSKEPTGGEWHCLPPANWLNVFDFSFRFVKTAVFNITTSEWGDRKGFMRIDVSRDSNVFCSTWKSFHPALPKFDLSKFQITWTMLTKEPVSARDVLESILLNFFSQGTADWITSIFGMCSECSKDAETLGGCGHMPEHCAEWGSQKYRECNIRDFPTNIGTLSCDGDAGWCAVDVGPWNNVCVRVQDLSPLGKGEDHTYSIGMHTHFDLKYAINFFVGILFVSQAAWVAEQRHIHYVIGYVFGACAAVLFLLHTLLKTSQHSIPSAFVRNFAGMAISYFAFTFSGPFWSNMVLPACLEILHQYLCMRKSCLVYSELTSTEFYYSWATKIIITSCGLLGMFAVSHFKIFKTVESEVPETDEFGREEQARHTPFSQRLLCDAILAVGYGMLCRCTSSGVGSGVLVFLLFFRSTISYKWQTFWQWRQSVHPSFFRKLMSADEYDRLGDEYTREELRKLRLNANEDQSWMGRIQNITPFQHFVHGGDHVDREEDEESDSGCCSYCTIS